MNLIENDCDDIIINTEIKLKNKTSIDIIKKREYNKHWIRNNRKKMNAYQKKYYNKNKKEIRYRNKKFPNKIRNRDLRTKYGITIEQYNEMLLKQNGCCAICRKPQNLFKRKLHVDHNHSTGLVRGLLCVNCNNGIGFFKEDISIMDRAKEYLKNQNGV